jgi:class 3 adenylate cyclase/pimeloyl-ACP methyl ester carboxylesterase
VDIPETRYAKTSEGVHIAYQVVGEGPTDIMITCLGYSNIEFLWHLPAVARFLRRLALFARIIVFDPRGMGLSDPLTIERLPTLETRMADTLAVMEAVGSERAALMSTDSMGPLTILFAATHPDRTAALILFGTTSCGKWKPEYPWGFTEEQWDDYSQDVVEHWGDPAHVKRYMERWVAPSIAGDDDAIRAWATYFRLAASPGTAAALDMMERDTDVRHLLRTIQVPTLVLHRDGDRFYDVNEGRYLADHIPGARFVELDGVDHAPWDGDSETVVAEVDRFLATVRGEEAEFDRVLATVLFTDIVGSTERAAELGDRAWGDLLERHHATVRAMIGRYRGKEVDTAGDGFLATFDGPARAVRCALAVSEAVRSLDIEIRAGVHTGEIELEGEDVRGIAVHIGARVGAKAGPSEVLVSSTVKDLVAGSGLGFEDAGEHELKGVPDRWHLYRVLQ